MKYITVFFFFKNSNAPLLTPQFLLHWHQTWFIDYTKDPHRFFSSQRLSLFKMHQDVDGKWHFKHILAIFYWIHFHCSFKINLKAEYFTVFWIFSHSNDNFKAKMAFLNSSSSFSHKEPINHQKKSTSHLDVICVFWYSWFVYFGIPIEFLTVA